MNNHSSVYKLIIHLRSRKSKSVVKKYVQYVQKDRNYVIYNYIVSTSKYDFENHY